MCKEHRNFRYITVEGNLNDLHLYLATLELKLTEVDLKEKLESYIVTVLDFNKSMSEKGELLIGAKFINFQNNSKHLQKYGFKVYKFNEGMILR